MKGKTANPLDGLPLQQNVPVVEHPEAKVAHRLGGNGLGSVDPVGEGDGLNTVAGWPQAELERKAEKYWHEGGMIPFPNIFIESNPS